MALFILTTEPVLAQDKLVPFNNKEFEKVANKVDQNDYKNMVKWASEVFRLYSEQNAVDFTKKAYEDTIKAKIAVEKKYTKLLQDKASADAEKASLEAEKRLAEAKTKQHNRVVDSLKSIVKAREKTIENLQKGNASVVEKDKLLRVKDSIISVRDSNINSLKETSARQDGTLNKLMQDTVKLGRQITELNSELKNAQSSVNTLNQNLTNKTNEISALNRKVDSLTAKNSELAGTIKQYESAFKNTENTINDIYNLNQTKSIVEMDADQLMKAGNAFHGIEPLLRVANPKLAQDLEKRVNEIGEWKSAIEPLKGAKDYMKGKYDNKQRQLWISKLKSMKLNSDKAKVECEKILKAMEDQERVKQIYDIIVEEKLAPENVVNDGNNLKRIKSEYEIVKGYDKKINIDYYDSYKAATKIINDELNKEEPSKNLNSIENFARFIEELRNMF
jgi:chromosome segregation ATPase